jgi:tripartite motif-containing protein 71
MCNIRRMRFPLAGTRTPRRVILLCALVGVLASGAGAAGAVDQFGSYGNGAGEFIEPNGIAVDQESSDVYILDTNNYRVEKFTKEGVFLFAWGWGVADGRTHALQICTTTCFAGFRGSGAGQLGFAEGVAVDNDPLSPSYKDVYVVDLGNHRVQKFSPTGEFLLMFGGEVNKTAHKTGETDEEDVCPVRPGDRCKDGTAGRADGQFEFPVEGNFIAVGPTGTVCVGDRNRVQEFSSKGVYQSQVKLLPEPVGAGNEVGGTSGLAVDSKGNLYVIRIGVSGVNVYEPPGRLLWTLDEQGEPENPEGPTPAMTLDSSGHVFIDYYVNEQHRIDEFDSSTGAKLASFDAGTEDSLHGIVFGEHIGKLYVVNTNNNVTPIIARVRIISLPQLYGAIPSFWG